MAFCPQSPSSTNGSFVDSSDPLTGHSYLLHTLPVFVAQWGLTWLKTTHYLHTTLIGVCPPRFLTLCPSIQFTWFHLHLMPKGLSSYTLLTGSRWADCRDVYSIIRCAPFIMVLGFPTQPSRRLMMMSHSNCWAPGPCYLSSSTLVPLKVS